MTSIAATEGLGPQKMSEIDFQLALEALFEFYVANGVDICLEESPQDRFSESAKLAEELASRAKSLQKSPASQKLRANQETDSKSQKKTAAIPDKEVIQNARDQAKTATDLKTLHELLKNFNGCNLKLTAKNLCFSDGNPEARVMFVGEAPGRDEDIQGKPFVGRSGQLLDRMLKAIGLDRSSVYIANIVPWRPPGNRAPSTNEIEICMPFIARQIELANPDFLVCLGGVSAQNFIGENAGIMRLRGKWKEYETSSRKIPCLAMFHPAYLLRQPIQKKLAWRDMLELKDALGKKN